MEFIMNVLVWLLLNVHILPCSVEDLNRFPWTAETCETYYWIARHHEEAVYYNKDKAWMDDAEWRKSCWWYLYSAKHGEVNRINNLERLRALIGDDNYGLGSMPDYLPIYRFKDREKP